MKKKKNIGRIAVATTNDKVGELLEIGRQQDEAAQAGAAGVINRATTPDTPVYMRDTLDRPREYAQTCGAGGLAGCVCGMCEDPTPASTTKAAVPHLDPAQRDVLPSTADDELASLLTDYEGMDNCGDVACTNYQARLEYLAGVKALIATRERISFEKGADAWQCYLWDVDSMGKEVALKKYEERKAEFLAKESQQ